MLAESAETLVPDEPGAGVDRPSELSGSSKKAVFKRAVSEFKNDNLTTLAAALTYYAVLAVVPGLIVLISILGLVGRDVTSRVTSQVQSLAPGSSAAFVHSLISQAQHHKSPRIVPACHLVLGQPQRQARRHQVDQPRRHFRNGPVDRDVSPLCALRHELFFLRQDVRILSGRCDLFGVVVVNECRSLAGRRGECGV